MKIAITAIAVLYRYLRNINYPREATPRLVQTAILIAVTCWTLFAIAQGSLHLSSLLLPLAGACLPLLLSLLGMRQPALHSGCFFALLVVAEHLKLNALILGIGYLLCMAALKVPLVLPLPSVWMSRLQTSIATPLILTFGIVQIDVHSAMDSLGWVQLAALLMLPIASKLLGNWLGLGWAGASFEGASRWWESVLLNIRGLSEIVFLNLLLQQHLISPALYFALILMGLIATWLPALVGMHRIPMNIAAPARNPHANS
jgi:hypothetical protein